MARSRFESNPDGIADLLLAGKVLADLEQRGERMAAQVRSAGIRVSGEPGRDELPVRVVSSRGSKRVRVRVVIPHPAALAVEAKHRLLGGAIDAARG